MCEWLDDWFFKLPKIRNRIWETDKLSKKILMILRVAMFLILFEVNVLNFVNYVEISGLRVFSLTSCTLIFSLLTYGFIMADLLNESKSSWVWKVAHLMYEIFLSFSVALTIVYLVVIICSWLPVERRDLDDLNENWIDITVKVQLYTIVLAAYLIDFYTNRIEIPFRHIVLVILVVLVAVGVYVGVSSADSSIDDFFDWSDSSSFGFLIAAAVLIVGIFCCAALLSQQKKRRYLIQSEASKEKNNKMAPTVHISYDNA